MLFNNSHSHMKLKVLLDIERHLCILEFRARAITLFSSVSVLNQTINRVLLGVSQRKLSINMLLYKIHLNPVGQKQTKRMQINKFISSIHLMRIRVKVLCFSTVSVSPISKNLNMNITQIIYLISRIALRTLIFATFAVTLLKSTIQTTIFNFIITLWSYNCYQRRVHLFNNREILDSKQRSLLLMKLK